MSNSKLCFVICFVAILASCSTYTKVSLKHLEECQISESELQKLEFVLKKQKLHYLHTDKKIITHNYMDNNPVPYDKYETHIQSNVLIPKGAPGICVIPDLPYMVIDFGKGVQVPFVLSEEGNHALRTIEIDRQIFSLSENDNRACLYFNSKDLESK